MKYIIILGDGMADEPIQELGGKTPLEFAHTPFMDRIASEGASGVLKSIPEGFAPGSEVAHLSLLGYDVAEVFEGRGTLEAASMGVDILDGEVALRCNLITIEQGLIKNHSAGHISDREASELIDYLQENLKEQSISLFAGVSYRHLLKIKDANKNIKTIPPHDATRTPFMDVMPTAITAEGEATADLLCKLILRSQELLDNHPINVKRRANGQCPANSIWPWSPGYRPRMHKITEHYGIGSGAVISAVDLIKGIGIYAGLESLDVEGATGLYDTNYEGKAQTAIEALRTHDFVFLHIEAPDEAGHQGDYNLKIKTIEDLDSRIVKPIYQEITKWEQDVSIAILPDHPTPCRIRTHSADAVPFVIWRSNHNSATTDTDEINKYDERSAKEGYFGTLDTDQFIKIFLRKQ